MSTCKHVGIAHTRTTGTHGASCSQQMVTTPPPAEGCPPNTATLCNRCRDRIDTDTVPEIVAAVVGGNEPFVRRSDCSCSSSSPFGTQRCVQGSASRFGQPQRSHRAVRYPWPAWYVLNDVVPVPLLRSQSFTTAVPFAPRKTMRGPHCVILYYNPKANCCSISSTYGQ